MLNTSACSAGKLKINLQGNLRQRALYHSKCTLRSHFDSIRGLQFLALTEGQQALLSASEDGTVKVWDVARFSNFKDVSQHDLNLEPYLTLRGHSHSILTLSAQPSRTGGVAVTGAANGEIKVWNIPSSQVVGDIYGPSREHCVATW